MNSRCIGNVKSTQMRRSDYENLDQVPGNDRGSEEYLLHSNSTQPKDKYNFAMVTFFLMGACSLLPRSFLITANDYWMYKFRDAGSSYDPKKKTSLQTTFTSYLVIVYYLPYVSVLFLNAIIGHKISEVKRICVSLFAMTVFFSAFTAMVKINTDEWQTTFFIITMVFVFSNSVACAIFQGGISGLASLFTSKYIHAMVSGKVFAGIFAAVAQILSLAQQSHPTDSAFGYFASAVVFLIIVTAFYPIMQKSSFYQFFLLDRNQQGNILKLENLPLNSTSVVLLILRKIWIHGLSILIIYCVSFSVYPAICVLVVPEHYQRNYSLSGVYFLPVCCFLLYNLSELTGTLISKWIPLPRSWKWQFLALSCLRIVFIPLVMLCNCQPRHHLPVVFGDAVYIVLVVGMGLTTEYLTTIGMMFGPLYVKHEFREVAGFIMVASLGIGLTCGSILSYPLLKLI